MQESSKKAKSSSVKRTVTKTQPKTIRVYSKKLSDEEFARMSDFFERYGRCRHFFLNRYCGINSMLAVNNWQALRNQVRKWDKPVKGSKGKLETVYNFQTKHWVGALREACANIKSMWSNLANRLKKLIQGNENFSADQRHLLFFILKFKSAWQAVLLHKPIELPEEYSEALAEIETKLKHKQIKQAYSYLCRITYRYHYRARKSGKLGSSMKCDLNWAFEGNTFSFSSDVPRKQFSVEMTSPWSYPRTGDITVVLDRIKQRLEVHKLISSKRYSNDSKKAIGIDKGLATLLSCSSGNEYGKNFSKLANAIVDKYGKRNANRQPYMSLRWQLNQQLEQLEKANQPLSKTALRKKRKLLGKLKNLEQNNIGRKSYDKSYRSAHETVRSFINCAINRMIETEHPAVIAKEDLMFVKEKGVKSDNSRFARKMRKRLNSWTKGQLDERIEYLSSKNSIETHDVNPAYTSQYCSICGQHFEERYGSHHELTKCKKCGKMNANIAAAKNILSRLTDEEITLYTPYKRVKEILVSRIKEA
ncbi:transposase [Lactobacillus delbrueckii]|uniref:transposase n=1 Tax=Lactobacillus delbrueckii TaxID=1584 RepID=UPI0022AF195F|nr:transposase [Lactobacillus delbrueckii]